MKHWNKPLPTIFSKYHASTCKVCFPIGRFVLMSSIYELMTKVFCDLKKINDTVMQTTCTDFQFDFSKVQKQLESVIQIHLD